MKDSIIMTNPHEHPEQCEFDLAAPEHLWVVRFADADTFIHLYDVEIMANGIENAQAKARDRFEERFPHWDDYIIIATHDQGARN